MDKHIQDIDSDVEILEPEILKNRYRHQELRLIRALSKYAECQIPKKWEDFQIFIKDVLKFNLSPNLVRSVWVQLHACYHQATSSCTVVEIIDVEEGKEFLEQHNDKEFSREFDRIIHEESKFDNKEQKCNDEQSFVCVEISDEETEIVLNQQNDYGNNIGEVINEKLKPDLKKEKFSKEEASGCVEINNDRLKPDLKRARSNNPEDFVEISSDGLRYDLKRSKSCVEESYDCVKINNDRLKPDLKRANFSNSEDIVEINGDESEIVVKKQNDSFTNIIGIIHEKLKPDLEGGKSSKEESHNYIEINNDRLKPDLKKRAKSSNPEECVKINGGRLKHDFKRTKSCDKDASDCIEINDDESEYAVKQQNDCRNEIRGVIHERLKSVLRRGKSSKEELSDFVKISNERLKPDLNKSKSIKPEDCVEIDDDECELVVKQQNEHFINVKRIIHEKSKLLENAKKSSDEQSSKYVEISDEDEDEQNDKPFSNIEGVIHEKLITGNKGGNKSSDDVKSHYVEISDDEEDDIVVEVTDGEFFKVEEWNNGPSSDFIKINGGKGHDTKHLQQFSKIRGFIDQELMSCDNGEKSYNEQMSSNVLINEPNTDQNAMTPTYFYKKSYIPRRLLAGRFSMGNGRKRNQNRSRRSLPNPVKEAEAEALREKLLLDKIIELELPQVMNSFLKKNCIIKNRAKKRRKNSINNTEPINGASSIINSASEPS